MTRTPAIWGVIPAAGIGQRMGSKVPKQYLTIGGKTVLEHGLDALYSSPLVRAVVVAVTPNDARWDQLALSFDRPLLRATGGAERSDSVLNALRGIDGQADPDDWVAVHDAARPCLRYEDLQRLIEALHDDQVGGLLAVPVRDTMKQADGNARVQRTLNRENLWHAVTPQMFRYLPLLDALNQVNRTSQSVTDEASAMEAAGFSPQLVEGHADNVKITRPEDLALAEFYLRKQDRI